MTDKSLLPCKSGGHVGSTSSSTFVPVRCEFCELEFNCDLDVSRHLASEKHRESLDHFLAVQNQIDKTIQKDIPKRLDQVFQAIKVRDVKDLKDLADKGFFEMNDESIAEIGDRLAKSLVKAFFEYDSRCLPPRIGVKFIEQLVALTNESDNIPTSSAASVSSAFTNTSSDFQTFLPSTSKPPNPTQQQAPFAVVQPVTNLTTEQQVEKQRPIPPVNSTVTPQTKSKTNPTSRQAADHSTQNLSSSNRPKTMVKPNLSRAAVSIPVTTTTTTTQLPKQTSSSPKSRQAPPRTTGTKATNVISPPSAGSNQQNSNQRTVTATTTATVPQAYRPAPASVLAQRSGHTPQVARANQVNQSTAAPVAQFTSSNASNGSQTNHPTINVISPLPGTLRVQPIPRPLEQSTYRVKLATIKVEPKE